MGKIINFKQARKKVVRIKKEKLASEKRIKHGQKKLTQGLIKRNKKNLKNHLDNHKINNGDSESKS